MVTERLTPNPSTSTFGEERDELITAQPAPLKLNHPLAIETQQGAGLAQLSQTDDEIRGDGQRGSSGGGGPPGVGEPPGGGISPEQPREYRTPSGSRPPEQLGRSGPHGGGDPLEPPGDALPRSGQVLEVSDTSTSCWPCCK